jgi:hypothetical protein
VLVFWGKRNTAERPGNKRVELSNKFSVIWREWNVVLALLLGSDFYGWKAPSKRFF